MTFLVAIALLGVVIFIHEMGHFLACKMVGVKVEKFSIGLGPALWKKSFGETQYILAAVPFGGYVKMLGEHKEPEDENQPPLSEEDQRRAFPAKPIPARALIVLMGPLFNIAFAVLLYWGVFMVGYPSLMAEIGRVDEGSAAYEAGLLAGDRVLAVDGVEMADWFQMTEVIKGSPGKALSLLVERKGGSLSLVATPRASEGKNLFGEPVEHGKLGIMQSGARITVKFGPARAFTRGIKQCVELTRLTFVSIWKLIRQVIPAETLGGPVMIVQMAERSAREGALMYFNMMALISLSLGVFNLLPIPVLDGGHILFMCIEAARRRPVSERMMEVSQRVGIAVLLSLMLFVTYNDIVRLISGKDIMP